jgi:HK97 family phage prohead protease
MIRLTADLPTLDFAKSDSDAPASISGIAVPWAPVTATVLGGQRVAFERGAFDVNQKAAKLIEGHDLTQLRGTVNALADMDEGLGFTATFARTRASADAVELIRSGAYDAVSVGAEVQESYYDKELKATVVTRASLVELSLVAVPAFSGAEIQTLVAQADEPDETEIPTETTPPTPSEEDETMSEPTSVEAAIATQPIYATAKREFKLPSMSEYISAFVRGGSDFAQLNENIRAAAPNVTTPDIPGVIPTPIIQNVFNSFVGSRPLVDATTLRPMPQGGSVFIRPVVNVHNSVGTATQNTTITASAFGIDDVQITKTIQGGYVEISEAAIDWSQPEALGPLLDDMARVYADRTDLLACSELQTGTTNSNNFANASIADPAYWVEWMYTAAADILTGSNGNLPSILAVSPNVWKAMGSLSDTADRPLFPQVGPMNAYGSLNVASTQGAFAFGLRVVVDRNLTSAGMTILDPRALENYEMAKGAVSVEMPSQLSRQIAFRGYWASKVIDPTLTIKAAFV